ncbi:tetratricopeptide repeat (TPR)-like superfamily protein [Wolffia australiana]
MASAMAAARLRFFSIGRGRCTPSPQLLRGFCTATDQSVGEAVPESVDLAPTTTITTTTEKGAERKGRRRPAGSAPLQETICHMMAKRAWTTRLQNSIRSICPSFDEELVLAVVRGAREPDHALHFFRWVEKTGFRHSAGTYGEMVRLLARHRMLNHARCLILEDMPKRGLAPDEKMLAALIEGYGLAGIPQEAVKIFRRMPELGVARGVRSYEAFFKAILRSGRAMMAKRYFNQMLREGVEPTIFTFNTLIWGFCLCRRMATAARFFSAAKDRGVSPDAVTYNTLLGGWVRCGKLGDAQKVFEEMAQAGLAPNSISYSLLIKGCVVAGELEAALQLYAKMGDKGIRPTEQTYAALLPGLCVEPGRLGEAKRLLDEMAERRIPLRGAASAVLRLISGLCEAGRSDEALQVLQTAEEGLQARPMLAHCDVLIKSLCAEGRQARAADLARQIVERGLILDPRSSGSILTGDNGDGGSSSSSSTSPPSSSSLGLSPGAYIPVIEHLCGNGSTKEAEALFRHLMKRGADDGAAFSALIRGHSAEGAPEAATDMLSIAGRRGIAVEGGALAALAESFLRQGDPAAAKTSLDAMMERGELPSAELFRGVMAALFEDGRVQTASRLMRSMVEKGVKENQDLVQRVLEALLSRGHVEEALGRIRMLRLSGCAPDMDGLLLALCDKRKTIPAASAAEFALDEDCDVAVSTLDRVLDALTADGKTMRAYALLCKLKSKGGLMANQKGCHALVKTLVEQGKTDEADRLYRLVFGKPRPADPCC